jgi:hypothetical protein
MKNEKGLILQKTNGTAYYQFEHLAAFPEIAHGIFTRSGGFSRPPFHRLNTSLSVGDSRAAVRRNREQVARCLEAGELVFADQVHGDRALAVEDTPLQAAAAGAKAATAADALASARPGECLVVQVADCQPVLLYDPRRRVAANVHSGWRGSIANILGRTVAWMAGRYGTRAGDLLAGIGPSLGPCCAEFVNYRREIPAELWGYRLGADHFDFWAMSRDQLTGAGVAPENIRISGLCTRCHTGEFFSYRGEKRTGRFPAVIGLR